MAQPWSAQTDSCWWDQMVLQESTKSCQGCWAEESPESQSKAQSSRAGWALDVSSGQVCCCCALLLGRAGAEQTSPGPALAGAHTADVTAGANLSFKAIFTEGKTPDISSVFSDALAFQYSCFQFRCFREKKGKRRGKWELFFYRKAQFF